MLSPVHKSNSAKMVECVQNEGQDRRSPPLCTPKKICLDSKANAQSNAIHDKKQKKKSVTFNATLEERIEFEDDLDSQTARKLYWEFMAADRVRFRDRIKRMEDVLSPILTAAHRSRIYTHRMGNIPAVQCSAVNEARLVEMEEIEMMVVVEQEITTLCHVVST